QLLRVQLHSFPGGTDEAVPATTCVLRDLWPARADIDRDRCRGPVIDRGVLRVVVLAVERHRLLGPELANEPHRLAQPSESLAIVRPLDAESTLVQVLARADAEDHPAGCSTPRVPNAWATIP